ncbi:hypothetical protein BN946_scf184844.g21 [Trametes cinnabarina]|uniref:Uncharacterized protein n=1 Tax=Pycnoporus cinnabarinus TaxID=5643 RepID=A0A060S930_PYCCI|nr:hypothetical protein BN946_scf184844.g21 [Trametes cinnabarina]
MPDQTTHTTTPEYSFWGATFRFSSRVTDWPSNQANPEHTVDVRRPWVPSPYNRATDVEEGPSPRSTSTRKRNWDATREHMDERLQRRDITPADWRAYGYWARPTLNNYGITVNNATPAENPRELSPPEVDAMLASLREPGGQTHPENWVPRVRHPSLPPRPDLWPTPPQFPEPLPSEIQLNPWLVYRRMGALPLHFDLRFRAADIILGSPPLSDLHRELAGLRADFGCDGPNGSQPATYPGVPRLR